MNSEAKNLDAIHAAIEDHKRRCAFQPVAIAMNSFEAHRLGWECLWGLPIRPDPKLGTGRFRVVCSREEPRAEVAGVEEREAVPA